jgi:hypothetical protein
MGVAARRLRFEPVTARLDGGLGLPARRQRLPTLRTLISDPDFLRARTAIGHWSSWS